MLRNTNYTSAFFKYILNSSNIISKLYQLIAKPKIKAKKECSSELTVN